jgi:dipeptidyl aminopeptidase/acylaminoacyl peptidase
MRTHRISFLAALVAAIVLTGCGSSGIGDILGGSTGSGTSTDQSLTNVRGTVERVNTTERYIVVDREDSSYNLRNGGDDEVVLYYDDRTTVEHQGRNYEPNDLEAGDRILAEVDESGGRLRVDEIQVLYDVTGGASDNDNDDYADDDRYDNDVRTTELRGTVRYVDTRDQTLELEPSTGRSGLVVVHYDTSTIVEFEGRRYKPENLERGDQVEIEVRNLNGRMIAEEILVVGEATSR